MRVLAAIFPHLIFIEVRSNIQKARELECFKDFKEIYKAISVAVIYFRFDIKA